MDKSKLITAAQAKKLIKNSSNRIKKLVEKEMLRRSAEAIFNIANSGQKTISLRYFYKKCIEEVEPALSSTLYTADELLDKVHPVLKNLRSRGFLVSYTDGDSLHISIP